MKVRLILIALAVVAIAGIFFAGYAAAGFTGNGLPGITNPAPSPELLDEVSADFDVFWEAWDRLQESYYEGPRDVGDLVRGATRGMVSSAGDPHTVYVDAELARLDRERLEGSFDGIGATVELDDDGHLRIIRPLPGSPAEASGLRAGDVVISVDGLATRGRDLVDIIQQVRGPRGTEVLLTVQRAGEPEPLNFIVVRDEIVVPSVISDIIDGYGYVRLTTFGVRTADDLHSALQAFRDAGVLGIILDLRNNPGGLLESAIDVSSEFLPRDTILVREDTRDEGERDISLVPCPHHPRSSGRRSHQWRQRQRLRDRRRRHSRLRPRRPHRRDDLRERLRANPVFSLRRVRGPRHRRHLAHPQRPAPRRRGHRARFQPRVQQRRTRHS